MKKVIIFGLLITATTGAMAKTCGRNLSTADRLYCQFEQNRAPAYYAGCFDIYAQLEGIEQAKTVCAGAYEDHQEYKKQIKQKAQ